jgi:hypothetical protein
MAPPEVTTPPVVTVPPVVTAPPVPDPPEPCEASDGIPEAGVLELHPAQPSDARRRTRWKRGISVFENMIATPSGSDVDEITNIVAYRS